MGVRNFSKVFDHSGEVTLKDLSGLTVCIDAMCEIYRAMLGMKSTKGLTDSSGRPTMHIATIINNILSMKRYDMTQIWVFDHSEPNERKRLENEERSFRRKMAEVRLAKAKNAKKEKERKRGDLEKPALFSDSDEEHEEAIIKHEKQAFSMKSWMINDIKFILNCLNIQWVEAPKGVEAECVCAGMVEDGFAEMVISSDTDCAMFGAPMFIRRDARTKKFYRYVLEDMLEQHNITRECLVKVGIVLGTDFYKDKDKLFHGIGPKRVIAKVKSGELDNKFMSPDVADAINYFMKKCDHFQWHNKKKRKVHQSFGRKGIEVLIEWIVREKTFRRDLWENRFRKVLGY